MKKSAMIKPQKLVSPKKDMPMQKPMEQPKEIIPKRERELIFRKIMHPELNYGISGNWVGFPDLIMSGMTTKETLSHQIEVIIIEIRNALKKYHFKEANEDYGNKAAVADYFRKVAEKQKHIVSVLEDLVIPDLSGAEDILIAVTGVISYEVYMYRRFKELLDTIDSWKEKEMWSDDCNFDKRLFLGLKCWKGLMSLEDESQKVRVNV